MRRRVLGCLLLLLAALSAPGFAAGGSKSELTVFAASSLTNALQDIAAAYTRETNEQVRFSFAASSTLARQIESGADANIFFAADLEWMNYLQSRGLIDKQSRRDVLGNQLVLIAPADSKIELKIEPRFKLLQALHGGRLATGDPDSVPVGKYAQSALTTLGVWGEIVDHLVRAENVRSAMAFVARGEAPLGIVYTTDAVIDKKVRIVDTFPPESHLPITYPIALTKTAHPGAQKFVDYLRGPSGQAVFKQYGFAVLP